MIKAVLDTNVYISALFWKGPPHKVFKKALEDHFLIIVSQEILDEISGKLEEKFGVPKLIVVSGDKNCQSKRILRCFIEEWVGGVVLKETNSGIF